MTTPVTSHIAIVGMACRYPDAQSPVELWENVLAQRRAFRRMPPERLCLEDYLSADGSLPDCTYSAEAALIEGYEFDRVRFRVAGSTFRSADLAHWLALDIASQALEDAGFPEGEGLPRETTSVLLGNTLTGEFSRANVMRLRWPYVRRVLEAALIEEGWESGQRRAFLESLEVQYKAPFEPVGEETLAGGLSNTIAGRICNHFDLKGGGYTLDGACASSLLAVATACSALVAGDIDVALAGGVDLSLDPFELVGFAKVGALAPEEMRVYDARSAGFWPGEGCGFVVLMRHEDAVAMNEVNRRSGSSQHRRIYAVIRGWGISSDGSGGITRPEAEGQLLALRRAYRRAGFSISTVTYFEGHGTGTSVGDATELRALSRALQEETMKDMPQGHPPTVAVIGSIKANIGHTKAASGAAGLIKATMALHNCLLPPTTGCETPHPELTGETHAEGGHEAPPLQVLSEGEPWPQKRLLRAGVSAMGFGGINTHIVLEGIATEQRKTLSERERALLSSAQNAELFLLSARDADGLRQQVEHLLTFAARLSRSELADLAAQLAKTLDDCGVASFSLRQVRAAVIASSPAELASRLETLRSWLTNEAVTQLDTRDGVFLGADVSEPRIGFLFPGQGSPTHLNGGILRRRFEFVQELYARANLPAGSDSIVTSVAQPAIVTASLAALRTLDQLGVRASIAVGHSLGELTALHWAGTLDEEALLRIATVRGKVMAELGSPTGTMASIGAGQIEVEELLSKQKNTHEVNIAGLNSPYQTVISGEASAVAAVIARAQARGLRTVKLPVSHAFHSPLVAAAAPVLAEHLSREEFQPLQRTVVSTVTGAPLAPDTDVRALLCRQVTSPVRFQEAVISAVEAVNLLIEVGPGQVLSGLVTDFIETPVVALDTCGTSLKGLLQAVGAAFALGASVNHNALFDGRFTRPFNLDWQPRFFVNPCELAPMPETGKPESRKARKPVGEAIPRIGESQTDPLPRKPKTFARHEAISEANTSEEKVSTSPLDLIRQLVAERTELPPSAVKDDNRLLSDLHLNSITVGQLVAEAARRLNLPPPVAPTDYADATIAEIAGALEDLQRNGGSMLLDEEERVPSGVDAWVRTFTVEFIERPLPEFGTPKSQKGGWRVIAPSDHPLATPLQQAFDGSKSGAGVVVCLPPQPDERHLKLLLEGAQAVLQEGGEEKSIFVLVQHGGGGAAFARTLHLEAPDITTCVVDVPLDHPKATEWVIAEAMSAVGYTEAHYDASGRRREPVLRLLPTPEFVLDANKELRPERVAADLPLGSTDVLLVTGGGKGITAECALSLARETGTRLALLGRSQPQESAELAANLERMAATGIDFVYLSADVTDEKAVRAAIREVESTLGPVTAILHGAGANVPQPLRTLDEAAFLKTVAPKVQGARNLLAAINPAHLRLFVTFGSIIARTGMRGEADYALANEWLTHLTERFAAEHPDCRCLAVEWSVWSGVGMGERLGRVDALMQQGITPITPDEGIRALRRLLAQYGQVYPQGVQPTPVSVVVTGRFGEPPTLKMEQSELPFLRFLEQPRIFYPGVELVVDTELSTDTDPYLKEHVFKENQLLPAVMGLEAMAQAAIALVGSYPQGVQPTGPPSFEDVQFARPVVVADPASLPQGTAPTVKIRVAALASGPNTVEVVLRSRETAFQADHFKATCRFGNPKSEIRIQTFSKSLDSEFPPVGIDPERELYGGLLFQGGRFQRLRGYRRLMAKECIAEVAPDSEAVWFSRYLPQTLVLGDAAARDATIHAIQACVPHATLLPIGVERLVPGTTRTPGPWFVHARERSREDDIFTYDVNVTSANGHLLERWEGLRLKVVAGTAIQGPWVEPLLGPYIERRVGELIPSSLTSVVVERDASTDRRSRSDKAIQRALGTPSVPIQRRPDGKPEIEADSDVSAAHAGDLTLAVTGPGPIGCDIEPVVARPASVWQDLLGKERFMLTEVIAQEASEDGDTAATRVWAASECLKKAGAMVNAPLMLVSSTADGWVLLAAGALVTATFVAPVRGIQEPVVLAVLVHCQD